MSQIRARLCAALVLILSHTPVIAWAGGFNESCMERRIWDIVPKQSIVLFLIFLMISCLFFGVWFTKRWASKSLPNIDQSEHSFTRKNVQIAASFDMFIMSIIVSVFLFILSCCLLLLIEFNINHGKRYVNVSQKGSHNYYPGSMAVGRMNEEPEKYARPEEVECFESTRF